MSLTLALSTAISGITVAQKGLDVVANNITNSNTPGYTRKTVNLETQTLGIDSGLGSGVKVASITRTINESIQLEQRRQLGIYRQSEVVNQFLGRTESIFGNTSANSDLTAQLTKLSNSFSAVAVNPNDPIRHIELVNQARSVARQIQSAEASIQEIRKDVDQQIGSEVAIVNAELDKIALLNDRISRSYITGQPTGDLEDQRDLAINKIAEKVDISVLVKDNKEAVIYMRSGYKLIDNTPQYLDYTAVTSIDSSVRVENGSFNPLTFKDIAIPTDLTGQLRKGSLQGLLELRDELLPALSDQLENITGALVDNINSIHNQGTAFPPPQLLTGTRVVNGTDPFFASGGMRIALTNDSGNIIDYIDLDLSAITAAPGSDVNSFMAAINSATTVIGGVAFNTLGNASLVNGQLRIDAGLGRRIAIGNDDVGPQARENISGNNQGISQFFGLNDVFENSLNQSNPPLVTSRRSVTSIDSFAGTGIVRFGVTNAAGTVINSLDLDLATLPPGGTIADLVTAINASAPLTMTARINSLGKLELKADNSPDGVEVTLMQPAATVTSTGENFIAFFDLKDSRNTSASIKLKASLEAQPQTLARGALNSSNIVGPIPVTAPISAITAGDAKIVNDMAKSFNSQTIFGASGKISTVQTTLTGYAALFLSNNAQMNAAAQDSYLSNKSMNTEIETRFSSISAVDIQEEMAQLTVLENAHNAAAQVLRTTGQMFDALEAILR